jgi:hypothetical protein
MIFSYLKVNIINMIGFQEPATALMENIIDLHNFIVCLFYLFQDLFFGY